MKLKKKELISQGSLNRMIQTAEAARERMDFRTCIETLQAVARLAPANVGVLLQLGCIHGLRCDYAAAERCFEQALRIAPRKTGMLVAIAEHCQNFRNPDFAERYLRRALEQPDATPQACIKLAELYERLRRLPEAAELVERALALNPAYPAALLVRARLERLAGRLEIAEQVLRSFITKSVPDIWIHAQAWYELAAILDRQQKFDDAMSAFLNAKTLIRPQTPRPLDESKAVRARLNVMKSNVTSEIFQHWFDGGRELLPTRRLALLCGHPRSGTTLLEQVLDSHPDIVSAEETDVFLDDAFSLVKRHSSPDTYMVPALDAAKITTLQQARAAYFQTMELALNQPIANRLLLDKNPTRTFMIPAFIRIFPETKFLIALRDPRDVVLSCFMQFQPFDPFRESNLNLEETTDGYTFTMSLWQTFAPLMPGRYLEVRYEDMVNGLESVARRTLDFLGVPWDAHVLGFDKHARQKHVRSPTYADVTKPVYKGAIGRWHNYQKYLEQHLEKLKPFIKAFGYE
jgi:tetratricopeptide (TPR) repeat protein